jgi:hypothetical protein
MISGLPSSFRSFAIGSERRPGNRPESDPFGQGAAPPAFWELPSLPEGRA